MKAARYSQNVDATSAFVCTNSICQGVQVPSLWPFVFNMKQRIVFAHTSFKWANLASRNAGVTVVVVGIGSNKVPRECRLFEAGDDVSNIVRVVPNINAYLVGSKDIIVDKSRHRIDELSEMDFGSKAVDGGHLYLDRNEKEALEKTSPKSARFIRRVFGAAELVKGLERYCFWINDDEVPVAESIEPIADRLRAVRQMRLESQKAPTRAGASQPHKFEERRQVGNETIIALPRITSENRDYLPVGLLPAGTIVSSQLFAFYDCDLFYFSILASRLHWVWMGTVCGRLEMRFSYSNTLGWNTFPVPILTEKNKTDLERCAKDIILAREAHFPATIADLYDPDNMPADLREAHERNDEVLERIYIGRRFRNDTERLEKLFELYTKMIAGQGAVKKRKAGASA